jgi:hypothetical protein
MSNKRRMRGRTMIFLCAIGFVALSSFVVWRRGQGIALGRQMRAMQDTLNTLLTEQADMRRDIRMESDRAHIMTAGKGLGLRVPADSQVRTLPSTPPRDSVAQTPSVHDHDTP